MAIRISRHNNTYDARNVWVTCGIDYTCNNVIIEHKWLSWVNIAFSLDSYSKMNSKWWHTLIGIIIGLIVANNRWNYYMIIFHNITQLLACILCDQILSTSIILLYLWDSMFMIALSLCTLELLTSIYTLSKCFWWHHFIFKKWPSSSCLVMLCCYNKIITN